MADRLSRARAASHVTAERVREPGADGAGDRVVENGVDGKRDSDSQKQLGMGQGVVLMKM